VSVSFNNDAIVVNPDGRLDTYGASEMLFQENPSLQSAALNLSHRTEHCSQYNHIFVMCLNTNKG